MGEGGSDSIGLALLFFLNGAMGVVAVRDYFEKKKLLDKLEKAPAFNNSPEILDRVRRTGKTTIPYALVSGKILSTEAAIRANDGSEAVFSKFIVSQHKRTREEGGHWRDEVVPMQTISKFVTFGLAEPKTRVGEFPKDSSDWVVHNVSKDHPESTFMMLGSMGATKYDETGDELGLKPGDKVVMGIEKTEMMLKNYTMVTLSGALSVSQGGLIQLNAPATGDPYLVFNGNVREALEGHRAVRDLLLSVVILSGAMAICIGGTIAYRMWRSRRCPPKPEYPDIDDLGDVGDAPSSSFTL